MPLAPLNKAHVLSATIVAIIFLLALFAPMLSSADPETAHLANRLMPPSWEAPFGTDELGRDLFSRTLYGARVSLGIAVSVVLFGAFFGTLIGALAGYFGKWFEALTMRIMDALLALPTMVLAIALAAALGPGVVNAVIALGLLSIPIYARLARAETVAVKQHDFVKYSEAVGSGTLYQIRDNILPNIFSPILIYMTSHFAMSLLAAAALSFLGLGAQPPTPEWGALVDAGRPYILSHWWYCFFPGIFIVVTAFSFNVLGDALRDRWDPNVVA